MRALHWLPIAQRIEFKVLTLMHGAVHKGICKVKKIRKIPKKIGSGWVGPGLIRIKKIGKSSKNKVLRLYNSPLLGGARGATRRTSAY